MEALAHLAGAASARASRSVQGPPTSASSAVPSQSIALPRRTEVWRGSSFVGFSPARRSCWESAVCPASLTRRFVGRFVWRTVFLTSWARFPLPQSSLVFSSCSCPQCGFDRRVLVPEGVPSWLSPTLLARRGFVNRIREIPRVVDRFSSISPEHVKLVTACPPRLSCAVPDSAHRGKDR